jgi:hypothetical protein
VAEDAAVVLVVVLDVVRVEVLFDDEHAASATAVTTTATAVRTRRR